MMRRPLELACLIFLLLTMVPPPLRALPVVGRLAKVNGKNLAQIWAAYGSFPGGITLEGSALGLPQIETIRYDENRHLFVLNEELQYRSPVGKTALRELAASLLQDDLLGYSAENKGIVYGALLHRGPVAADLQKADYLFGAAVMSDIPGYLNIRFKDNRGTSIHFRLHDFVFVRKGNRLRLSGSELQVQLIPITGKKSNRGTFLADREALRAGWIPAVYLRKAEKLIADLDWYLRCEDVKRVVRYGEIAAFLRSVKSQGFDLQTLLKGTEKA